MIPLLSLPLEGNPTGFRGIQRNSPEFPPFRSFEKKGTECPKGTCTLGRGDPISRGITTPLHGVWAWPCCHPSPSVNPWLWYVAQPPPLVVVAAVCLLTAPPSPFSSISPHRSTLGTRCHPSRTRQESLSGWACGPQIHRGAGDVRDGCIKN